MKAIGVSYHFSAIKLDLPWQNGRPAKDENDQTWSKIFANWKSSERYKNAPTNARDASDGRCCVKNDVDCYGIDCMERDYAKQFVELLSKTNVKTTQTIDGKMTFKIRTRRHILNGFFHLVFLSMVVTTDKKALFYHHFSR